MGSRLRSLSHEPKVAYRVPRIHGFLESFTCDRCNSLESGPLGQLGTGRHYNAASVAATQLISDLMGRGGVYGPGRIIIESCSTKIVLKQDQAASQVLKEAFNLSDAEEKFIINAKIGHGILMTAEARLSFFNFLSDEEKRLFTTRPKEVTA